MKEEQIEQLLHRYMEATATAAEEEQLRQYFASGTCDARFEPYAPLFAAWPSGGDALSSEESEEILALCPPSPRTSLLPRRWWRYAAVWLFGIFLGGGGVWLSRGSHPASDASGDLLQAMTSTVPDTVVHERIVVQRDTVYLVKFKPVAAPQVRPPAAHTAVGEMAHEVEAGKHREISTPPAGMPWEETCNVASLAVR